MRCPFQAGEFPAPVKYGYASVGRIEAGPAELVGQRVFCLYPHQDRYIVPAASVVPVPERLPDGRAVLAANMEIAINALWDVPPRVGDAIAVIGAGVVGGLAAALVAHLPRVRLQLVDVNTARAALAEALGVPFVPPGRAAGGADLVIHASGSSDGLRTVLRLVGYEATVLELSWYGAGEVPAPLGEAVHSRRLVLKSSQVGAVAAPRRARRTRTQRLELALELLRDRRFDALVTSSGPLADLPRHMTLGASREDSLCHMVTYP
jgi:threonine dehydrogenase-like Zn-dependent dehydrogenase